ncbi:bifunctional 5,10-methylenetetrahydrofolate dehydrogenase/5,10-methenyltetrahydrofolate cyclohydrolase [Myxococcota bacterium]|nr:bifunctional 5,10-methylenetetrahydrofolate dehydrogenase/5,10-methenyltetrahydrofolate cyclohydrolase [Myxococcota bacterium]MBU1508832.1 bifunctional 5,10-methylenetetrahydrofolate dehydrogenase/5,10-methenyltetrahydrofolate cyclohydrolase [Myxococcota bacterium]
MTAAILDGTAAAAAIREELASRTANLPQLSLAVVLVGEDPASAVYVRNKEKACKKAGIRSIAHRLPADTSKEDLLALVATLNANPEIDGILVQLPLPGHLPERGILDAIVPEKDVDGFHPVNQGRVLLGDREALAPCTPAGIMELLHRNGHDVSGRRAVVVGRSTIVGRPLAALLISASATVTICHTKTRDLAAEVARAEFLFVAAGRRDVVKPEWITPGCVVVDVGIHRLDDGTLTGDLDFAPCAERAAAITPVPGGIGPMTIAMLLSNTVRAGISRRGLTDEDKSR